MPWMIIYGSVAVAVIGVLTLCFARSLRGDYLRVLAIAAAAALWPVMVVGLAQFGAVRVLAASLHRDSLARLARQIGAQHPA
jgi:hypothetical protein